MIPYRFAAFLAFVQGAYMLADGLHHLASGTYFGNGVGPWASLVARAGIDPQSRVMTLIFVGFGIAWIGASIALALRRARYGVAVLAVATFWYLPIGTLVSAVVLIVTQLRPRTA
ncbi:MAG TPA: hypothetical protein VGD01_02035 [Candidatus Elarobacter sp.]|jgi:hypothetical protein